MMKPAFYRHGHFAFDWYCKLHCDIIWTSVSCDGYRLSVTREWGTGGTPMWQSALKGLFSQCSKICLKWYFDTNISPNVYVVQEHLEIPPSSVWIWLSKPSVMFSKKNLPHIPCCFCQSTRRVDMIIVCLRPFHPPRKWFRHLAFLFSGKRATFNQSFEKFSFPDSSR